MDEKAKPHVISEPSAREMERRYRQNHVVESWKFPKAVYKELVDWPGCEHVQTSCGLKEDGSLQIILRAADAKGNVIPEAPVFEEAVPCPPWCNKLP